MSETGYGKTHFVRWDQPTTKTPWRETGRALCGRTVDLVRECSSNPTCPICRRKLAELERIDV